MIDFPAPVRRLVAAFRQLPSVGPRTAERLALHVLKGNTALAHDLADALREASEGIFPCKQCGFFADQELCEICRDATRDSKLLCVVESPTDVLAFEKSGVYHGFYHVLHGTLSPLDGIGPDELRIPDFLERIKKLSAEEVILGLGHDVRGETTALYLAGELREMGLRTTRLATGISAGSGLEFVDSLTLSHAFNDRKPMNA